VCKASTGPIPTRIIAAFSQSTGFLPLRPIARGGAEKDVQKERFLSTLESPRPLLAWVAPLPSFHFGAIQYCRIPAESAIALEAKLADRKTRRYGKGSDTARQSR